MTHAYKSEQSAAHQNSEKNPEAGQPRTVSQDLRSQNITVKLLQCQDEHQEPHTLLRIHHQQKQCRRDRSDKRTEKRDDIGDPYDAADQQRVLPSENRHAHEAQQTNDQRVYDLAIDKSAKGLIRKGSSIQDLLRRMFTKNATITFLLCAANRSLLFRK